MARPVVDLRSDTVTRPTQAMRRAMAEAEVGDAVYGEDPTVNRLERAVAERLGHEAALFVPSGTMGNQLAIAAQTIPGDAVICSASAHIARWEGGGAAATAGVQLLTVATDDGLPSLEALEATLPPDHIKAPRPAVLALEDTHNATGGRAHGPRAIHARVDWARARGMRAHLDGARLFNAAIATGTAPDVLAEPFDTISVCFSKGLGAPVGSALVGSREAIARADRVRHRIGGGWRQAGILAAAALYGLEHHVARLADDHERARAIAAALAASGKARATHPIDSNLICFRVSPEWGSADAFVAELASHGVKLYATGPETCRMVTHLGIDDAAVHQVCRAVEAI